MIATTLDGIIEVGVVKMDTGIAIALLSGVFALCSAVITGILAWQRDRLERRRVEHEERRWLLELHSRFELGLHDLRLKKYPEIFSALEVLSHYRQHELTVETARDLARKLNAWGYGEAGLCMLPDTRDSVFRLRQGLLKFSETEGQNHAAYMGARTDLIERLRRDLNHGPGGWRDLESLLEDITKRPEGPAAEGHAT